MRVRQAYHLPEDKQRLIRKGVVLEWTTVFFMLTIIAVMYFTMGSSQAMKAAWIEDLLSLVPPLSFLIATHFQDRPPNERFPYGYHRAASIAFLVASTALCIFGVYILYDSVMKLLLQEHPTIGMMHLFGYEFWAGWAMIVALVYSAIPPVILGRLKQPLARKIHDNTLHTDADMNKADWLTAVAGVLGILGIGMGWWWADSAAAGLISFDILKDGATNLKSVVEDLMDRRPQTVEGNDPDRIVEKVESALEQLEWVQAASARLREEGRVLNGEVFVIPRDEAHLTDRMNLAAEVAKQLDWRIYDIVAMPVHAFESPDSSSGSPASS